MNSRYRKLFNCSRNDYLVIKQLGDSYFKCALIKYKNNDEREYKKTTINTNDKKLENNLSRASSKIFEIAMCNDWEFFFTGTINPDKFDRTDFDSFYKAFSKWLSNYNYQHNLDIKYLLIPELHKDKINWHMHGLIKGLPLNILKINKFGYLDWSDYTQKFGFCSFATVYDNKGVSYYVTKYISKDILNSNLDIGKHLYYHSKGLKMANTLFKGSCYNIQNEFDYENDFCKIKSFNSEEELKKFFANSEFVQEI